MSGTQNPKLWTSPHLRPAVRPARAAQIRLWLYPSVLLLRRINWQVRPPLPYLSKDRPATTRAPLWPPTAFSQPLRRAPAQSHQERLTSRSSASAWSKLPPLFLRLALQLVGWSGETCQALGTCAW